MHGAKYLNYFQRVRLQIGRYRQYSSSVVYMVVAQYIVSYISAVVVCETAREASPLIMDARKGLRLSGGLSIPWDEGHGNVISGFLKIRGKLIMQKINKCLAHTLNVIHFQSCIFLNVMCI